ncbi:TPA: hypothetical protein I7768_01915 [Vibrio vulnificus]|nr:hypothetical protein CRN41_18935 [Vibrio vulnificus]HAS8475748.1 hypothetical protein [Vibrio vulnificus]
MGYDYSVLIKKCLIQSRRGIQKKRASLPAVQAWLLFAATLLGPRALMRFRHQNGWVTNRLPISVAKPSMVCL